MTNLQPGERVAGAHPIRNDFHWVGEVKEAYPAAGMALVEWQTGKNIPGSRCQYITTDLRRLR